MGATSTVPPLVLHEDPISGNCYKIRLTAALLGLPLERRPYDILKGETRTPEFLSRVNANGRIPVLQIGDRFLPESNAACFYLGDGSALVPEDRFARADMLRWMFWEQYHHEPTVATLRFWVAFKGEAGMSEAERTALPAKRVAAEGALAMMERHLSDHEWFVGGGITIADIALYAYTHVAPEGGLSLDALPHVRAWMARIAAQPGYVPML